MLMCYCIIFIIILALNIFKSNALTYTVDVKRYSSFPIISKTLGAKKDYYTSAALYTDEYGNIGAILEGKDRGETNSAFYHSTITFKNGIPVGTQPGNKPVFNISNIMAFPTITKYKEEYYVLFRDNVRMHVAVTSNPKDPNEWISDGIVAPSSNAAMFGAPLFATSENGLKQNYLFWSFRHNYYVYYATAPLQDISIWSEVNWIFRYAYAFDNTYVQTGNPPLMLKTGDFLHIYNGYSSTGRWSLGYVILDKTNPSSVKQRSTMPILSPILDWEFGNTTSFYGTNSVYLTGLLHDKINCPEENDWTQCFFGLYSGASSHIGAIKIIVSWQ